MVFVNDVIWPGIVAGSMYALVALGINVVERVTKVVNFAYAGFVLWAPLGVLILVRQFSVPVPLAFVLSTLGVVAIALVEERIAVRPFLRRSTAMPWLLSTLAVGLILERLANYQFAGQAQNFPHNVGRRGFELWGVQTSRTQILVVVASLAIVGVVELASRRTHVGRQLTAVAQDPDGAASIGISVTRASSTVMAASAVIASITGYLAAPSLQVAPVSLGLPLLFNGFVAAAIGGMGSIPGSLAGGLALGIVLQFASANFGANFLNITLFGTLLVVYLIRPQGLFGHKVMRTV